MFDLVGLDELEKLLTQTRTNSRLKKSSKQPINPYKTQFEALSWVDFVGLMSLVCKLLLHFYTLQTLFIFHYPFKYSFYYLFLSLSQLLTTTPLFHQSPTHIQLLRSHNQHNRLQPHTFITKHGDHTRVQNTK